MPGNKMTWKFFKLNKFNLLTKNNTQDYNTSLKEQWLYFLTNCSNTKSIPDNINEIIKEGYLLMKMTTWDRNQILAYYKQKQNVLYDDLSPKMEKQ